MIKVTGNSKGFKLKNASGVENNEVEQYNEDSLSISLDELYSLLGESGKNSMSVSEICECVRSSKKENTISKMSLSFIDDHYKKLSKSIKRAAREYADDESYFYITRIVFLKTDKNDFHSKIEEFERELGGIRLNKYIKQIKGTMSRNFSEGYKELLQLFKDNLNIPLEDSPNSCHINSSILFDITHKDNNDYEYILSLMNKVDSFYDEGGSVDVFYFNDKIYLLISKFY